ncbi:hypothetical protein GCM10007301_24010 [Azorhizobium oxalatiphilum]|uniref:Uncharacterized protein n=1 Tax=Azorhizobium oxalatiphilum TaxID=980631 RepID=A0A917FBI5_9HYPH|nr:DUF4946 domain-containing protein [Azorhizobium oxalatiphilum]GGF63388.1 hypothetical protein GCM10007301_24010 [Azorhizobium oxalatiphilum]
MTSARIRACTLALVLGAGLLGPSASHAADAQVTWPDGWQVGERPLQSRGPDGTPVSGMQRLAAKAGPDGKPDAIIVFFAFNRTEGPAPDLKTEAGLLAQQQQMRAPTGTRRTECGSLEDATIAGIAAQRMACATMEEGKPTLRQSVSVLVKDRSIVTFIYTAPEDSYDAHKATYDAVEASLKL